MSPDPSVVADATLYRGHNLRSQATSHPVTLYAQYLLYAVLFYHMEVDRTIDVTKYTIKIQDVFL